MGCTSCLKVFLIAINVIIILLGFGMIGAGVYHQFGKEIVGPYLSIAAVNHITFSVIAIVDGIMCIVIGGCGIHGARKEHTGCLVFYSSLLTLIFFIFIIAGGLAYGFRTKLGNTIQTGMTNSLNRYNSSTHDTSGWNEAQRTLKCCGVHNYTEYNNLKAWNSMSGTVFPSSCCPAGNSTDSTSTCPADDVYGMGCYNGVLTELEGKWYTWGGALIGIAVSLLFAVFLTCCYNRRITGYEAV